MQAAAAGNLGNLELKHDPRTVVTVMAVSGGYPEAYEKGMAISGLDKAGNSILFHAGTKIDGNGTLVTSGGRVIAASSYGNSIAEALEQSFAAAEAISFDGKYFRHDIGHDLMKLEK